MTQQRSPRPPRPPRPATGALCRFLRVLGSLHSGPWHGLSPLPRILFLAHPTSPTNPDTLIRILLKRAFLKRTGLGSCYTLTAPSECSSENIRTIMINACAFPPVFCTRSCALPTASSIRTHTRKVLSTSGRKEPTRAILRGQVGMLFKWRKLKQTQKLRRREPRIQKQLRPLNNKNTSNLIKRWANKLKDISQKEMHKGPIGR